MAEMTRADHHLRLRFWGWPTYTSLAITAAILGCLFATLDVPDIWRYIVAANPLWVALGGLAHYATYIVRGVRWRYGLAHMSPQAGARMFSLLLFFVNAVDNIIPAKLADVYAAHLVRVNGGVGRAAAFGSIVFLRMVDAWCVLGLAVVASWALFAARVPQSVR